MNSRATRSLAMALATAGVVFVVGGRVATQQTPQAGTASRRTFGPLTVTTIADGLEHPWSLAFLPDGAMLVTERVGRLRIIRNGALDPAPIAGIPAVYAKPYLGLLDVAVHPDFANNHFVYLTYNKSGPDLPPDQKQMRARLYLPYSSGGDPVPETARTQTTMALARGTWNGTALTDVRDIFVADDWKDESISQASTARMAFGRDGMLYVTNGGPNAPAHEGPYARTQGGVAQDPGRHGGKVLRLRDDGTAPKDNPFVGRRGYKPEIYTMGHRQAIGLTVHPETGALWEHENGPQDGDEVNILKAGANYGWPLTGMGRDYLGDFIGGAGSIGPPVGRKDASRMYMEGMEQPFLFWTPTVAPSGMTFYTGDKFPNWKGSLFIGLLKARRLERIVFNDKGGVVRREFLLEDLKQRIRDVRQGPDGFLYLLTDANPGAVLKLERTP
jgi:aldose sugar dehydrogenase